MSARVPFRPPLDWGALIAFLAARVVPGVEEVSGATYRRTAWLTGRAARVEVRLAGDGGSLAVEVQAVLGRDPFLAPAVRAHPGLRVPGGWEPFEVLVRAVLGQQITVAPAARLAGRVAERAGAPACLDGAPGLRVLFPRPEELAAQDPAGFPLPRSRGAALVALGSAVAGGMLVLARRERLEATLEALRAPGVGPWTAQLVAMRALREPDVFPAGDLALRRALGGGGAPVAEAEALRRAHAWRPWRAYAAQHLWVMDAARAR
jgi:AraC family transcriptional regulator of adaptative response / DNA-3-methyladenine glycosylase II